MGDVDQLCRLSAGDVLQRFADRSLSPVELLDAMYDRADAVEPDLNAWTDRRTEQAYEAARAAEARWAKGGDPSRPLDGVPVAMKEEHPIEGELWRLGSLLHEHDVATTSHPLYGRLVDAGAVIHARTTTPEFSSVPFTHSRIWGLTVNPWNREISCGGSSGGSAVSLASCTTTLATGSDIGGSIRIPSSLCGLVGFKPPQGRVPTMPPFNLDTYSHEGPMGRTVADVALMQNVIAGAHPMDHVSMRFPPTLPLDPEPVAGMRIALARTLGDFPVDRDVDANTVRVADVLRSLGAVVDEVEVAISRLDVLRAANVHFAAIWGASVIQDVGDRADLLSPYAADFTELTSRRRRRTFYDGLEMETAIHLAIARAMDGFDAMICPTLGSNGWAAGDDFLETKLVVDGVELETYVMGAITLPFNIASKHPVLNVPSGIADNGVPTGLQIVAPTYDDATAFRVGAALERELGWWHDPSWGPG